MKKSQKKKWMAALIGMCMILSACSGNTEKTVMEDGLKETVSGTSAHVQTKKDSESNSDVAGTYKFTALEIHGISLDKDALIQQSGKDANSVKTEIVLDKNGYFELNIDALGEKMYEKGTYKVSGSELTMTTSNGNMSATLEEGVITLEKDDMIMTFKKSDHVSDESSYEKLPTVTHSPKSQPESTSDVAGTYKFKTMKMEGITLDFDTLMKIADIDANSVKMELVLDEDGNFELNVDALDEDIYEKGTYKVSGSKLTLTTSEGDASAILEKDVITLEEDGVIMTFKKSDLSSDKSSYEKLPPVTYPPKSHSENNSDVAGTYKFKTMEMQGMSLDMDALMKQSGMDPNSVKMEIVLDEDGKFELNVDALGEGQSEFGTYKVSGSKLTMTTSEGSVSATLEDGVITMEEDGVKMTFVK